MTTTTAQFKEIFETFVSAKKFDSKGREIGFIVGFNDNGTDFHAWVQAARSTNGDFKDHGVRQRSVRFDTQEQANAWAYRTASERISKL